MQQNPFIDYTAGLVKKYFGEGNPERQINITDLYLKCDEEERKNMKDMFVTEAKHQGEDAEAAAREWDDLMCMALNKKINDEFGSIDERLDRSMKTMSSIYTSSPVYADPIKVSKHRCERKPLKRRKVKHGNRKKK